MNHARAFAPGNVSCVFKVVPDDDPRRMHSLGFGFTVSDGVTVSVSRAAATAIRFNGRPIRFPPVDDVVAALTREPMRIEIESPLPLSSGFGLSGASALASAYALDALLGTGRPREDLAMIAHVAEVRSLTGLGDVCNQYHGGCLVRLRPGHPLAATQLAVPEQPIWYRYFGPIHTRDILTDAGRRARIAAAADIALAALDALVRVEVVDFERAIRVARRFAAESGLLTHPDVLRTVEAIDRRGGAASMIMLGHAVFSTQEFEGAQKTRLSRRPAGLLS